jgi:hypothetical protein
MTNYDSWKTASSDDMYAESAEAATSFACPACAGEGYLCASGTEESVRCGKCFGHGTLCGECGGDGCGWCRDGRFPTGRQEVNRV